MIRVVQIGHVIKVTCKIIGNMLILKRWIVIGSVRIVLKLGIMKKKKQMVNLNQMVKWIVRLHALEKYLWL